MRAGDATTQRRRTLQQASLSLPTTSPVHDIGRTRQRRRKETISPTGLLTIVVLGTCIVFVVVSRVIKISKSKSAKARNKFTSESQDALGLHVGPETESLQDILQPDLDALGLDRGQGPIIPLSVIQNSNGNANDIKDDDTVPTISPTKGETLAKEESILALLYPPGLMGGYRNQVIRLLSLVVTAVKRDIHSLLLPSLMWTTQIKINDGLEKWVPIPHDLIFDVDHWNSFSHVLPKLVPDSPSLDCWTHDSSPAPANSTLLTRHVLDRGFLTPIATLARSLTTREIIIPNLRKIDLYPNVSHCTHPQVYGGGKGAGRLWQDYIALQKQGATRSSSSNNSASTTTLTTTNSAASKQKKWYGADAALLQALRPKQEWRDLAQSCVTDAYSAAAATAKATTNSNNSRNLHRDYVALHARMELEMMDHKCGKNMERNLTALFEHVEGFIMERMDSVGGVFVAVSRSGIELSTGKLYQKYKAYADDNLATLNRVVGDGRGSVGQGLGKDHVVFECGKRLMDKYYAANPDSADYGSLLQSVVNFHIATEAKAFIGVRGSSYSTDIWTTRYHQGKGHEF
ncbi:hypothetical protein MHU86_19937 [Fragilaria crotonensis]|nr:hypothetical protein MHU86_19937 [Fragilaria crotonensis]